MKESILLLFMTVSYVMAGSCAMAEPPMASMLNKGEVIFEKNFDDQEEVDGVMDLRKHTKGTVKDGVMVTIPPSVHGEAPKGARYGKEEFVRSHFKLGAQDYIFAFRVKFLALDREVGEKVLHFLTTLDSFRVLSGSAAAAEQRSGCQVHQGPCELSYFWRQPP